MNNWQDWLYPLGFVAQFIFFCRIFVQWLQSEMQHDSVASRTFWNLSIGGSFLMMLHTILQMQFHVSVIQACNAVIAWRNLNLMQPKEKHVTFQTIFKTMFLLTCCISTIFFMQWYYIYDGQGSWLRTPTFFQSEPLYENTWVWHLIGSIGIIMFAGRFWVQWWFAEKNQRSELGIQFWWLSLIGALFASSYFFRMLDFVNMMGPAMGIVPYIRNLVLLHKKHELKRTI